MESCVVRFEGRVWKVVHLHLLVIYLTQGTTYLKDRKAGATQGGALFQGAKSRAETVQRVKGGADPRQ